MNSKQYKKLLIDSIDVKNKPTAKNASPVCYANSEELRDGFKEYPKPENGSHNPSKKTAKPKKDLPVDPL